MSTIRPRRALAVGVGIIATVVVALHVPNLAFLVGGVVAVLAGSLIEHGGDPSNDAATDDGDAGDDGCGDGDAGCDGGGE